MGTERFRGALQPRLVAIAIAVLLLALALAFTGFSSGTHDATVSIAPVNSKAGEDIGYALTVANALGDNIDNVTLEIPLDEGGNARYRVATPVPAPLGWTSGVPEIDGSGYARKVRWLADNPWAHIAAGESENFTFTATTPENDGIYSWACLTRDVFGYVGLDSIATRVDNTSPPAPTLLEPENGAIVRDNTPTFRWTAVVDDSPPVTYTIQVDNENDFSSPEENVSGLIDNTHTSPAALADDNYSWRVRATDNVGNVGPFSSTWALQMVPWTGGVVVRGKSGAYNTNGGGMLQWVDYSAGDRPPIMVAQRVDAGAFVAGGIARTFYNYRWNDISPPNPDPHLDSLLDAAFQWMVPGAENVLWYERDLYFVTAQCSMLVAALEALGYNIDADDRTFEDLYAENGLENYDILIINQIQRGDRSMGGDPDLMRGTEVSVIENFVRSGGGLLITEAGDYGSHNYCRIQNKILDALGSDWWFQHDQVYDNIDNWGAWYEIVTDVDTTTPVGASYQLSTGTENIGLYNVCSLAPVQMHDPIYIDGNAGFTIPNPVNGGGSGTENDPYIIENWDISAENDNGIEIRNTTAYFVIRNCYVHELVFHPHFNYGICLENVKNGKTDNNFVKNNDAGILFENTFHSMITNSAFENTRLGIDFWDSSNNIVMNITISNSSYALDFWRSDNNIVENNLMENIRDESIILVDSHNNFVLNNIVKNNNYYGIDLVDSDNNLLENNLVENSLGIIFGDSDNNLVLNNLVKNNLWGIFSDSSHNNLILNNIVKNCFDGIFIIDSDNHLVSNNFVENNYHGIWLRRSDNNFVLNNLVENNNYYGIDLSESDNNRIYHNNLINNTNQAHDDGSNYWDDGYPSGGNYWSDYTGLDENHGENQDIPGSDSIGDAPYNIPGGSNQDRYPLMNPIPWTGTAVFSLVNLYTVNVEKIDLDLGQGSKLVVKFYTYGDAYENENVIETFSPPWHVEENESARHPESIGVKKVRLDLTTDDTENVISTIATFTVTRNTLAGRLVDIYLEWPFASLERKNVLNSEMVDLYLQWPFAPT